MCSVGKFYLWITIFIVVSDIGLIAMSTFLIFILMFGTHEGKHFQENFALSHTDNEMKSIEDNYVLLMFPIVIFLFVKTGYGIRWIYKGFTRTALQTFFLCSWSFYTSYAIQVSYILMMSWDTFNNDFRGLSMTSIIMCFPLFVLLNLYMRHMDRQNFAMNMIRKEASEKKRKIELQRQSDK